MLRLWESVAGLKYCGVCQVERTADPGLAQGEPRGSEYSDNRLELTLTPKGC